MGEYRIRKIVVRSGDPLFDYFDELTAKANNLSNAVRFRQRQLATAVKKDPSSLTQNEQDVLDEVALTNSGLADDRRFHPSEKRYNPSYAYLDSLMKATSNPDYLAHGLPRQTAQHVIKQCVQDMKSFFALVRVWKKNPSLLTGRPEMPGYRHKKGHSSCVITNQDSCLRLVNGKHYLKLPFTEKLLAVGTLDDGLVHKETKVVPDNGRYVVCLTFETKKEIPSLPEESTRIAAVDPGIDNLMAVTNNCGLPFILYKGGVVKSLNQRYNKLIAGIMSSQARSSSGRFSPTEEYYRITNRRNDCIDDFLHKTSKHFISWCVENRIDTVVFGVNKGWKQEVSLGHVNNQKFVQIPFFRLRNIIRYLCERIGIRYLEQEESYTSMASFPDGDFIPVYGNEPESFSFSGKRRPVRYKGTHKKDGFRGLYQTGDGTIINADLNGSANILRKAFPESFAEADFTDVTIIRHCEEERIRKNRERQRVLYVKSRSRVKREEKRCRRTALLSNA